MVIEPIRFFHTVPRISKWFNQSVFLLVSSYIYRRGICYQPKIFLWFCPTFQCQRLYHNIYFWRYLTRRLIWHLSQSSIRPSIYISSIVKSRSNLFLEPTSTKQQGLSFLLKETTGAFDGSWTHDLHITNQTCNPLRHAALLSFYYPCC